MSTSDNAALPGMVACAAQSIGVVESVRPMARQTWCMRLRAPELATAITPGQFFMIRPQEGADPLLGRPFALFDIWRDEHGAPAGVDFGFVEVGRMTGQMPHWSPGMSVRLWGPLGNGFPVSGAEHLLLVAGGIGQTPFLAVAREALGLESYGSPTRSVPNRPGSVQLLYGARSAEYLAGLPEFELPGLDVAVSTDDGSSGHHGFVTELLRSDSRLGREGTEVFCCGPEPMMKAVAEICRETNTPCQLSLETPMACGFGACFSCVAKIREPDGSWDYRRTCVEGPVFDASRLIL